MQNRRVVEELVCGSRSFSLNRGMWEALIFSGCILPEGSKMALYRGRGRKGQIRRIYFKPLSWGSKVVSEF